MNYVSTRGGVAGVPFQDAVLMGLADDGGLLVPAELPDIRGELNAWRDRSFPELAKAVVGVFADDLPPATISRLVDDAYASFDIPEVVRMIEVGDVNVLELFHGPTLAFKDVALQLLGQIFDHVLGARNQRLNIVGATSGDTGSAAIAGVRGRDNVHVFILFPEGRVSPLQELQMTTVPDANVHCIGIRGSFDDCQSIVKSAFADLTFKSEYQLGAVNSVNWARVLAQVVYYGYASLKFDAPVSFCVPTGNFGNVFAGYLAKRIGFPIRQLIVATNENDILARFFESGVYERGDVKQTHTPSMDIQVASNFERYLYYLFEEDAAQVRQFMSAFHETGRATVSRGTSDGTFVSTSVTNLQTESAIADVYRNTGYVADPHTAVGIAAAQRFADGTPMVCIATADPAKFPEVVDKMVGDTVAQHPRLDALSDLPARKTVLDASLEVVKQFIREHAPD